MVLWSTFDMKEASLARMYFFFIETWQLNFENGAFYTYQNYLR